MKLLSTNEFLSWAKTKAIEPDPDYSDPKELVYVSADSTWMRLMFDEIDMDPMLLLKKIMSAIAPWQMCRLWKRHPVWTSDEIVPLCGQDQGTCDLSCDSVLAPGFEGAVELANQELGAMLRLLHSVVTSAVTVWQDISVVPDHRQVIIEVTHHEEVILNSPDTRSLKILKRALKRKGVH